MSRGKSKASKLREPRGWTYFVETPSSLFRANIYRKIYLQKRAPISLPTYRQQITFHSYPTQKHQNFVAESMTIKPVTGLPGIGKVLGGRLESRGYSRANDVLRKFDDLGRDETQFTNWWRPTPVPTGSKPATVTVALASGVTISNNDHFCYIIFYNFVN